MSIQEQNQDFIFQCLLDHKRKLEVCFLTLLSTRQVASVFKIKIDELEMRLAEAETPQQFITELENEKKRFTEKIK